MPYNVLAGMAQGGMLKSPLDDYMEGRQQKFQNALTQKQSDNAAQELDLRKQQMEQVMAERQRQAQAAEQAQAKEFVSAALENLAGARDPVQFSNIADAVASSPIAQKLGVTREMITPENVSAMRARMGIAPPAPKYMAAGEHGVLQIGPNGTASMVPGSVPEPKSNIGNVSPGDFTPESLAKYTQTRNYADLVPVPKSRNGISVTSPDGTQINIGGDPNGPAGKVKLGNASRTDLEKKFMDSQGNAIALREQVSKWNPDFSTYQGRADAWWTNVKDKAGMASQEDQKALQDFTAWKSDTNSLLSQYLNQLSGAAISPAEEARLKAGFPNAEDGPTQYKSKVDATMKRFALVQARAAYLLSHPEISLDAVSIDGMQGKILTEANALAKSLESGGMQANQAKQEAIIRTRARYGLQ